MKQMLRICRARLAAFLERDQRGSISVEAVFAFPMLLWAATALFTFFDAFKVQNTSYRANYTISDMLSRQTEPLDQSIIDGMHNIFRYMTNSGNASTWIRVSVVRCTADCNDEQNRTLEFVWSASAGGARTLDSQDLTFYASKIPLVALGDPLILVETSRHYNPPFASALVSFAERDLVSHVVTRPRFANQVCWESCVNSTSTGDGSGNVSP